MAPFGFTQTGILAFLVGVWRFAALAAFSNLVF
jgi:hypothetical protein